MDWRTHPSFCRAALETFAAVCLLSGRPASALENTLSVARTEEVEEVTARFRAGLRSALEAGEAARQTWPKLAWQGIECYEPTAVAYTLERMKSDIEVATSIEPRLAALQVYVVGKLESIGRMPPTLIITERGSSPGQLRQLFGVRADQADVSWQELRDFTQHSLSGQSLVVDLSITSEPKEAKVALRVISGVVRQVTVVTDVQVYNLWRGVYRLTADKPGYKPAVLDLELMGQRSAAVSCTLAKAKSAEKSRCIQAVQSAH